MNKSKLLSTALMLTLGTGAMTAQEIIKSDATAYSWIGDSIIQGEYKAYAVSPTEIKSNYSARPHYYMPISKEWKLKNDISKYPQLKTSNKLHTAIYNMALDEMVNAVEPDTTLRTGKEWAGVWTRDVSYSIILSMAYMQPEASRVSLMKKVNKNGVIIQDTGSGGAWPVSSDRLVWALAAYEVYRMTGDKQWLKFIYNTIKKTVFDDMKVIKAADGLMRGETSFIDWREQSYPKWMQTVDIYNSEAMGTNVVYSEALNVLAKCAEALGKKSEVTEYTNLRTQLIKDINEKFWMEDKGYYGMYLYGRDNLILNPRAETLGESLSILYGVADSDRAKTIARSNPMTPFGPAIFYPQISDMPNYHNNALWPFVGAFWALAEAKAQNEQGVLQGIGSIFRPAALFCTNKENFNLDNGDIYTELNSSNMLWCLSGNLALTYRILFGINFEDNQLSFAPVIPQALADRRELTNFPYRNATLDITVNGYGTQIKSFKVNGKEQKTFAIPAKTKGHVKVEIEMANNSFPEVKVNNVKNLKAPITPITWLCNDPYLNSNEEGKPVNNRLYWNPIEYIDHYIVVVDGVRVAQTKETTFIADVPGEYQVIGVSADGTESFASEPRSNRSYTLYELPNEKETASSSEISYQPTTPIKGYSGEGFVEIDHNSAAVSVPITIDEEGDYAISLRYANGNGPINTENKCAIRTLLVDGNIAGTIVMPHRGVANWNDWGFSNSVHSHLVAGQHTVSVEFFPSDENMNLSTNHALLDIIKVTRLKENLKGNSK